MAARDEIKKIFDNSSAPMSGDMMTEFFQLLDLPDNVFDNAYPAIEDGINKAFEDENLVRQIREAMATTPIVNLDEEVAAAKEAIENIKVDDELSENKKKFLINILDKGIIAVVDVYNNPRDRIEVAIERINEKAKIPEYAHDSDAGADIFAIEDTIIEPGETKMIATGLKVAIPKGYEIQLRPRSGLSLKSGLRVANAPATIDANYRGEIKIIMWNSGTTSYTIKKGDKIAQMLIAPTPMIKFTETSITDETDRGEGGFGSSDT